MIRWLSLITLALIVSLVWGPNLHAQDHTDAWATGPLNMRTGPNQDFTSITQLAPDTGLTLEARNPEATWVLGTTLDTRFRGWVAAEYLKYDSQFRVVDLAVSDEILESTVPYESVDLTAYPVVPQSLGQARVIFAAGQARGRAENVVAKVGDCNSIEWRFLHPFGLGEYDLGAYGELAKVVEHFSASLAYRTYAAHNGLTVNGALDPVWASPAVCFANESPLVCELRLHNPSMAVIMFGTNDMIVLTPNQFDYYLRQVVRTTIQAGVVPILSTFPRHLAFPDRSITFNQIVVLVAQEYDVPLINLWLALEPLPNHGIAGDGFHLSGTMQGAGMLTEDNLRYGYTVRNLVTLQALDAIWQAVTSE